MGFDDLVFLGDSTWTDEEFIKNAAPYINKNVAFSTLYTDEELVTDRSEEFLDAYKAEYGDETPDPATALAFDAYILVIEAIERAGAGCSGSELRDAIMATDAFEGASGIITFNNTGDPKKSVVINTVDNNKISVLCTIEPEGVKKQSADDKEKENSDGTED